MNYEAATKFELNKRLAELTTDGDVIEFDNMFPAPADSPDSVQIVYKWNSRRVQRLLQQLERHHADCG